MIQKIMPKLDAISKKPIRSTLQKTALVGLGVLAGSSMSGWHGPHFTPTEMIIPGGLDLKEKAYYFLRGKLPESVYERWTSHGKGYEPQPGDDVVTVNIGDGRYVGEILEPPHEVGTKADYDTTDLGHDISDDLTDALGDDADVAGDGDDDLSLFEIWKRLAGF